MTTKDDIFTTDDDKRALMIFIASDRLCICGARSTNKQQLMNCATNTQPAARNAGNDTT